MNKTTIRTRYSEQGAKPALCFADSPSRAKQEFKADADINSIVSRYLKSGSILLPTSQPVYADVSDGNTYHALQNQIAYVKQVFADLPSDVRADFGNDPAAMLDWVSDPENAEDARSLGLLPEVGNSTSLGVTVPTDTKKPANDEQGPAEGGKSAEPSPKSDAPE